MVISTSTVCGRNSPDFFFVVFAWFFFFHNIVFFVRVMIETYPPFHLIPVPPGLKSIANRVLEHRKLVKYTASGETGVLSPPLEEVIHKSHTHAHATRNSLLLSTHAYSHKSLLWGFNTRVISCSLQS